MEKSIENNQTDVLMLYQSDLQSLISKWTERLNSTSNSQPYKDSLGECIQELNGLLDASIQEEFYNSMPPEDVEEEFLERQADEWNQEHCLDPIWY